MMSQWIKVEDKLPANGKRVIFFWMNNYNPPKPRTSIGFYAAKHTVDADYWDDVECADYSEDKDQYFCPEGWHEEGWELEYISDVTGVTHWMPLPEPPEDE